MSSRSVATGAGGSPGTQLRIEPLTWETYSGTLEHLTRLPHHWKLTYEQPQYREYRLNGSGGFQVALWLYQASDRNTWLRLQARHPRRTPSWVELLSVVRLFVGRRRSYMEISPPPVALSTLPHRLTVYANLDSSPTGHQLPILPMPDTWLTEYPEAQSEGAPQSEWDWNASHPDPSWP